jgi:predicted nucleotidyltransferase component of viral defense system
MIEELKAHALAESIPWQTLVKEWLQRLFLGTYYSFPESSPATFQGGTCLRLLHGGPRHSEDLDFVTMEALETTDALRPRVFEKLKALEALADGSLEMTVQKSYSNILRWKLKWAPPGAGEKVFVRVEFARYPAHTRELKPLGGVPGMPAGAWIVIPVETRGEILTDKIAAVAGRPYLKGRDFFDLWFLESQGVPLDAGLLRRKLQDYGATLERLAERALQVDAELLRRDLTPFLPLSIRRPLEADGYKGVLETSKAVLRRALELLAA